MAIRDDEDLATTQLLDHEPTRPPADVAIERNATAAQPPLREPPTIEDRGPKPPSRPDPRHEPETATEPERRTPAEQQRLDLVELRQRTIRQRDADQRRLDELPTPTIRRWRPPRDPHAAERATFTARIDAADQHLDRLRPDLTAIRGRALAQERRRAEEDGHAIPHSSELSPSTNQRARHVDPPDLVGDH